MQTKIERSPGLSRIRSFSLLFPGAVLIAFLIEFLCVFKYDALLENLSNTLKKTDYSIEQLSYANLEINKDGFITNDIDAQIIAHGLNTYVYSIEISLSDLSSNGVPVVIYYNEGTGFNEEDTVKADYYESEKSKIITLGKDASDIRVDISTDHDSYHLDSLIINPSIFDYFLSALENLSYLRIIIYSFFTFLILALLDNFSLTKDFIYDHRWSFGAVIIIISTLMKLHGSSIGYLSRILSGYDVSRLWGIPRGIRSDEYAIFTEMALSQVKSGFKWFSEIWGFSPSDMFIVYGQPVLNLMTIFRPFSAFYIIGGAEYGLAFYWISRLVILFLVSFEFARLILLKNDHILALIYALLVTFSPLVQWWFSINELVETLIFGQLAVLLVYLYIREISLKKKVLYIIGLIICGVGYVLVLYPAWMIPFFYVFLVCVINVFIDNRLGKCQVQGQ